MAKSRDKRQKSKIRLSDNSKISQPAATSSKFDASDIKYHERPVRFSLRYSHIGNNSIISLGPEQFKNLCERLGYFEDMTIGKIRQLPRENGLTSEKRKSENYKRLDSIYRDYNFDSYFHFRIRKKELARVFAAAKAGLYYLLEFDLTGKRNH